MKFLSHIAAWLGLDGHLHHDVKNSELGQQYLEHLSYYGKSYGTIEEYNFRFEQFARIDKEIKKINSDPDNTFTAGHNMFSTMTKEEYKKRLGKKQMYKTTNLGETVSLDVSKLAADVDWRTKGAVNKVQDQGDCGSCWAFSSIAAIEAAHWQQSQKLLKLSEQQFVDCVKEDQGCDGGEEKDAFRFAEKTGVELESNYPYKGKTHKCREVKGKELVKVTKFTQVEKKKVAQLKAAIAIQPVCVGVDAESNAWQTYKHGIFNPKKCGHKEADLDHAITAVGYGNEDGKEYFIVRNSWGADWGEEGYIRIDADKDGPGVCGILLDSVRPTTD